MWSAARLRIGDQRALSPHLHLGVSGIGAANARAAAIGLLDAGCEALVSWGTAGALRPDLRSGQLVMADQVVDVHGERLIPDRDWAQRVMSRLGTRAEVLVAGVAGTDRILNSAEAKQSLGAASAAAIVDMESTELARVAAERGIPLLVLRAVVDEIDMVIPGSIIAATDASGRVNTVRLLLRLLGQPSDWLGVWRLARAFGHAHRSLETAARCLRPDFAFVSRSTGA